jgi:hypothetical protein
VDHSSRCIFEKSVSHRVYTQSSCLFFLQALAGERRDSNMIETARARNFVVEAWLKRNCLTKTSNPIYNDYVNELIKSFLNYSNCFYYSYIK